jgi:hypothetical protein
VARFLPFGLIVPINKADDKITTRPPHVWSQGAFTQLYPRKNWRWNIGTRGDYKIDTIGAIHSGTREGNPRTTRQRQSPTQPTLNKKAQTRQTNKGASSGNPKVDEPHQQVDDREPLWQCSRYRKELNRFGCRVQQKVLSSLLTTKKHITEKGPKR